MRTAQRLRSGLIHGVVVIVMIIVSLMAQLYILYNDGRVLESTSLYFIHKFTFLKFPEVSKGVFRK